MADKMSKEEAKKEFNRWFNPDDFPNRHLVVYEVSQLIDAIEPDHEKVVLPKAVGEQWDTLVDYYHSYNSGENDWSAVDYALNRISELEAAHDKYYELTNWWVNTKDSCAQLVDAARYGWVAKPEKLYRVKVYGIDLPALFYRKRDDGTQSFVQGGAGLPETEFTMNEIKQRHLENCEREEVIDDGE